ncbi:Aldo/keto reductase [Neolentinus lepideus HHB14362 ss-1]|uniref:Aldo/keto reductase n=1 Tax=Neolentinus lepideus HHB14362 ss-1 TaxID=1314782 RepID=A0A165R1P3_9AGAM|nr:Aldo/keto reductase [Neolentinus lepideus HHB14362 ss-1]
MTLLPCAFADNVDVRRSRSFPNQARALPSARPAPRDPFQLGVMSIGDKWKKFRFGPMDKESLFELLDAYFDAGGNFIDIATSYNNFQAANPNVKQCVNFLGNNLKNLKLSVEESLRRLRTSYIDILYLHFWDLHTKIEEVMDGLHMLVLSGKVLYLGISDSPSWLVTKANVYAKYTGKTPFVRDIERDILPMRRYEGHSRSDAEEDKRKQSGETARTPGEKKVSPPGISDIQLHCTAVVIAYTMHKAPFVFPIIGGRKIAHLEGILPFDKGFPQNMIGVYGTYLFLLKSFAQQVY